MVQRTRLELHDILEKIPGVADAYYSPPASIQMEYPCIRYELSGAPQRYADNKKYFGTRRYTLTLIDDDPDSDIVDRILELPYSSFDRAYAADGLMHFVFTLYF